MNRFTVCFICCAIVALVSCTDKPTDLGVSQPSGIIVIQSSPDSIFAPWRLNGPIIEIEGVADSLLSDMAVGDYQVTWELVEGWLQPDPGVINGTLHADSVLFFTGDYARAPGNSFRISGVVVQGGQPAAGARITVEQSEEFSSIADNTGTYILENVPPGEFTLHVDRTDTSSGSVGPQSFAETSLQIAVSADTVLPEIVLSQWVVLGRPDMTSGTVRLHWSPTDAPDFWAYDLYRHDSAEMDPHTATWIHGTHGLEDTTFVETGPLYPDMYFYRVYVKNPQTRLAGSNVADAPVEPTQLIIRLDYRGNEQVTESSKVYYGFTPGFFEPEFDHHGSFSVNGATTIHIVEDEVLSADLSDDFYWTNIYLAAFLDYNGVFRETPSPGHEVVYPSLAPSIFYDGIDPGDPDSGTPTQIAILKGTSLEIDLIFDDSYRIPVDVSAIRLLPYSESIPIGYQTRFIAHVYDQTNDEVTADQCTWSSSDAGLASVDNTGLVTPIGLGTVQLTTSLGGVTSEPVVLVITEDQFTAGRRQGDGIHIGDYGFGVGFGDWLGTIVDIDLNNDGARDFRVYQILCGGLNRDHITLISPEDGNGIAVDEAYCLQAEAMFASAFDTTLYHPAYADLFSSWAAPQATGDVISEDLTWSNARASVRYHIAREDVMVSMNFGLWADGTMKYAALRVGTPPNATYGWVFLDKDKVLAFAGRE